MKRYLLLAALFALPLISQAQFKPTGGSLATISYDPEKAGIFRSLDNMKVVYAVNFWNTRQGTRLALQENVLRPDTNRVKTAPLKKAGLGWAAYLEIPENASVLSYYITDGTVKDDNGGKTFTAYVYTQEGNPVPNAHYFMVPFLQLAGAGLVERMREAEEEIRLYPKNFRAYTQFFTLQMEQERGGERVQRRIIAKLDEIEQQYGTDPECLNLIARTYYYTLRNTEKGLEYKNKIAADQRWKEVDAIFDSKQMIEEKRQRAQAMEQARNAILNTEPPDIGFITMSDGRFAVQELKGKPVVMVFWATTSDNSKSLFKFLGDLCERMKDKEVTVVAVNTGEDKAVVQEFIDKHSYPFEFVFKNGAAMKLYGVDGLPRTFIIDRGGIIRNAFAGYSVAQIPDIELAVEAAAK